MMEKRCFAASPDAFSSARPDMLAQSLPIIPPTPKVHAKDLPTWRHLLTAQRNSIAIFPDYAFDVPCARRTLLGIDAVLINDPEGIRHVLATNAANYVRPTMMPRVLRPLLGQGIFLAEGAEWRRQRRMLSPAFTPHNVDLLLPHFTAAANDLLRRLEPSTTADLSAAFQVATLEAALRALFSMPDSIQRARLGAMVRGYVEGPGRPNLLDMLADDESAFAFATRGRRTFQKAWFAAVDEVVAQRRQSPPDGRHRDLLDLLLAARNVKTGEALFANEVRDQCATMIFGGFETTARLLFWASYLLTLDLPEQERLRAEVEAFSPERLSSLDDLANWPRLRMTLLETLRLYPPVPHLVREAVGDDEILGEPVKVSSQIWISPWVLHRHRKFWEHPTAFMPERFAGKPSPWTAIGAYLPFGAGPRTCIGATFAISEAHIVMATLLRRYRIIRDDLRPVRPVARVTIEPNFAPMFRLERV
jgi:cytochrome P450